MQKATKLLGFRDEQGALVCPSEVLDTSKTYSVHLGAEDGSWTPSADEAKRVGELLKELGLSGSVTIGKGKGGHAFFSKKGVVLCRIVEGKAAAPPPPPPPEPEPEPEPEDEPTDPGEPAEEPAARDTVRVTTTRRKKKSTKKRSTKKR